MAFGAYLTFNLQFRRLNAEASTKCYYRVVAGEVDNDNIQGIANLVGLVLNNAFTAMMAYPVSAGPPTVVWRSGATELEATGDESTIVTNGGVGTSGTPLDSMPEQNAIVLQKRTNLAGRNKRGRWFVPFVPESFFADSTITEAGLLVCQAMGQELVGDQVPSGTGVTLRPVHKDNKLQVLNDILHVRVLSEVGSRRDRRDIKKPIAYLAQ